MVGVKKLSEFVSLFSHSDTETETTSTSQWFPLFGDVSAKKHPKPYGWVEGRPHMLRRLSYIYGAAQDTERGDVHTK